MSYGKFGRLWENCTIVHSSIVLFPSIANVKLIMVYRIECRELEEVGFEV